MEYSGATGQILRWYAYGLGPNDALGQVDVAANSRATFIPDMLGSVIGIIDGQGALTKIGYAPFGASPAAIAAPLRFTGQRRDAETGGLHYYRARMYAPSWGRFMQVDPIGYQGGVNLYAYVGNDPLNAVDVFGLAGSAPQAKFSGSNIGGLSNFQVAGSVSFADVGLTGQSVSSIADVPVRLAAEIPREVQRQIGSAGGRVSGEGLGGGPPASAPGGSLTHPLQAPAGPPRNPPGEIRGISYSGHALDQLQNRGIPPSVVEQAIRSGTSFPGNTPGTTRHYDALNNISVVTDNASRRVITVRPGR